MPQAGDIAPALGTSGPGGARACLARDQDGSEEGIALAASCDSAEDHRTGAEQSLGDSREGRGKADEQHRRGLEGVLCELVGLKDTRIHDCRHAFASRTLALGENLPMIGPYSGTRSCRRQSAIRTSTGTGCTKRRFASRRASRVIPYRDTPGQKPQRFGRRLERLWKQRKERA